MFCAVAKPSSIKAVNRTVGDRDSILANDCSEARERWTLTQCDNAVIKWGVKDERMIAGSTV